MSQEHIEITQQLYAAFGRRDLPAILDMLTNDVEWGEPSNPYNPTGGTRIGHEGFLEWSNIGRLAEDILLLETRRDGEDLRIGFRASCDLPRWQGGKVSGVLRYVRRRRGVPPGRWRLVPCKRKMLTDDDSVAVVGHLKCRAIAFVSFAGVPPLIVGVLLLVHMSGLPRPERPPFVMSGFGLCAAGLVLLPCAVAPFRPEGT